jgi:hypothetical protein
MICVDYGKGDEPAAIMGPAFKDRKYRKVRFLMDYLLAFAL